MADHRLIAIAGHALRRIAALHRVFANRSEIVHAPAADNRVFALTASLLERYEVYHRISLMSLETIRPYIASDYNDRLFSIKSEILEEYTGPASDRVFSMNAEYLYPAQQHLIFSASAEIVQSPDADHRLIAMSAEYLKPLPDHRLIEINSEIIFDAINEFVSHRIACMKLEYLLPISPSEATRAVSISMH